MSRDGLFYDSADFWYVITFADTAIFSSAGVLREVLGSQLMWVLWKYYWSFPFFRSPCCCILLAILVSAAKSIRFSVNVVFVDVLLKIFLEVLAAAFFLQYQFLLMIYRILLNTWLPCWCQYLILWRVSVVCHCSCCMRRS